MLKRLRLKFICILMAIVMVMLSVIFGLTIQLTHKNLREQSIRDMQQILSSPSFLLGSTDSPINSIFHNRHSYFVLTGTADGKALLVSTCAMELSADAPLDEFWQEAHAHRTTGVIRSHALRYYRAQTPIGEICLYLDITGELRAIQNLYRNCSVIGLVAMLAFLPISILLARWAVKPVAKAWDQQRQFIADASHDLKTPLTVIITNAELLQNPDHDEAARSRFTQSILTMSQDMRHLVEGLLELARADNGTVQAAQEPVDLSQLVQEAALPFEAVFFEKELLLCLQAEPDLQVQGSPTQLKQVVEVLLDNARKYSDPGQVTVALQRQGKYALLSVANPGAPLTKADLNNIFKRFYRIDQARSRNGSYGLGLSIAQSIVTGHGGRIWAESKDGCNTFFVQLPIM